MYLCFTITMLDYKTRSRFLRFPLIPYEYGSKYLLRRYLDPPTPPPNWSPTDRRMKWLRVCLHNFHTDHPKCRRRVFSLPKLVRLGVQASSLLNEIFKHKAIHTKTRPVDSVSATEISYKRPKNIMYGILTLENHRRGICQSHGLSGVEYSSILLAHDHFEHEIAWLFVGMFACLDIYEYTRIDIFLYVVQTPSANRRRARRVPPVVGPTSGGAARWKEKLRPMKPKGVSGHLRMFT